MPDWRDQYLANLQEAERNNPVNHDLVTACSQLADRVAALEAEKAILQQQQQQPQPPQPSGPDSSTTPSPGTVTPSATDTTNPTTAQLRLDLAEALRSRGQLDTKHRAAEAELKRLRGQTSADGKRVRELTAERNALAARLRDRSEELVGKNRLLDDVQDENLTLNIELDARDRELRALKADNKQLVDRWMRRVAQDADAMNLANASEPDPQQVMMNGRR